MVSYLNNNLFQILASVGSLATFGLLCFTVWQHKKNLQKERDELERSQAKNVSAWVVSNEGLSTWLAVSNQSESPVYEVIVSLVAFQGAGDLIGKTIPNDHRACLSVLPPGVSYVKTIGHRGMMFHASAAIAFIDNVGTNWIREGNGSLYKIDSKPVEYYDISRPLIWDYPLEKIGNKFILI